MKVIYQKIIRRAGIIVNSFIIKNKRYIYVQPHKNCKNDKYDLINCNADNSLKVLNYFLKNYSGQKVVIFLEYYDLNRTREITNYINSIGNQQIQVKLLESTWGRSDGKTISNAWRYCKNSLHRFRCSVWVCDTGWSRFWDKVKSQKVINYNYCTPFKKGGIQDHTLSFNYIDFLCQTSTMCAEVVSSEYEASIDNFSIIGFARNDTLYDTDKEKEIENWLIKNEIFGKRIIFYVPTYRPELVDYTGLNIFGLKDNGELKKILDDYNATIITKLHPVQRKYLAKLPENYISLEPTYEFSIYDLFKYGSVLISDYSSISTDFLISKKPVIYLFSDIDKYDVERGFSFNPIESVCCGEVDYCWDDLKKSLKYALEEPEKYVQPYIDKINIWHKYIDDKSTERSYELLKSLLV